jgi:hypothetical protein
MQVSGRMGFRSRRPGSGVTELQWAAAWGTRPNWRVLEWLGRAGVRISLLLALQFLLGVNPLAAREKEKVSYGEGLIVNIPMPEGEVEQVVVEVAQNGVIRGTKEYNKDEFVAGAKIADSSRVFPAWDQGGKVIYKVREQAIDPRNFKDTSDVGTLVVRYVLQPQGDKNTVLRIDALFKEDYRHVVHQSNGSVETAEYKDIREHLDEIQTMKSQNVEAEKEREEQLAKKRSAARNNPPPSPANPWPGQPSGQVAEVRSDRPAQAAPPASPAPARSNPSASSQVASSQVASEQVASEQGPSDPAPAGQTLEERVKDLRRQVERVVKSPGAPLKSAPFHTASTLQLLSTGTEVLIVISTTYWYGVETHDGQHGWIQRDQLEMMP